MRPEELDTMCRQAGQDLLARASSRPIRPAVVLPLPGRTRIVELASWPDDDERRTDVLERFASDEMRPENAAAWGFVAEATLATDPPQDVIVAVYSARGLHPRVTVAPAAADGSLGEFVAPEEIAPAAFPFLAPLQRAADAARAPDVFETGAPHEPG